MSRISVMIVFHINIADLTLPIWWLNLFENVLFCLLSGCNDAVWAGMDVN